MHPPVDDVERGDRQDQPGVARKLRNVLVERNVLLSSARLGGDGSLR